MQSDFFRPHEWAYMQKRRLPPNVLTGTTGDLTPSKNRSGPRGLTKTAIVANRSLASLSTTENKTFSFGNEPAYAA